MGFLKLSNIYHNVFILIKFFLLRLVNRRLTFHIHIVCIITKKVSNLFLQKLLDSKELTYKSIKKGALLLQSGKGVIGRLARPLHVPYSFALPYSYTTPSGTRPTST